MKIFIPHLCYTVYVKKPTKVKPIENAIAWVQYRDRDSCELFINQPIKPHQVPTLAHELIHVLQLIAEERNIHFTSDREHFGYLMQWLMNEILGYHYTR